MNLNHIKLLCKMDMKALDIHSIGARTLREVNELEKLGLIEEAKEAFAPQLQLTNKGKNLLAHLVDSANDYITSV